MNCYWNFAYANICSQRNKPGVYIPYQIPSSNGIYTCRQCINTAGVNKYCFYTANLFTDTWVMILTTSYFSIWVGVIETRVEPLYCDQYLHIARTESHAIHPNNHILGITCASSRLQCSDIIHLHDYMWSKLHTWPWHAFERGHPLLWHRTDVNVYSAHAAWPFSFIRANFPVHCSWIHPHH